MELRGKQKRFLRSKAHHLQPIFQIGKGGVSGPMLTQIGEALEKRELIKVSLLQNTDEIATDVAHILADEVHCQVLGGFWFCIVQVAKKNINEFQKK